MAESISFDRAAAIYDATRALDDTVAGRITDALLAEIEAIGAGRLLEVGIGTGRMARPLMRAGVRIVGVDISAPMMARLREQLTPDHSQPDLLLGDATALPLRDRSFRAALVVHVLHLVSSVEGALGEIRRVLAPGGVLLQQTRRADGPTRRMWDESEEVWDRLLQARGFTRRNRLELNQPGLRRRILATGAELRLVDAAEDESPSTVDEEMERLRTRTSSWTWEVPDATFDDCLPEYETWLRAAASPDGTFVDRTTKEIEVWRWP